MATLAHTKTPEQLAKEFHVNLSTGLSAAQAAEHQQKYGKNGAFGTLLPSAWHRNQLQAC